MEAPEALPTVTRTMDFKQLRYFIAIADAGSLLRASERINIAQPALSVQLANLEAELGTQLVVRSNRGIELTDDGNILLLHARELIEKHSSVLAEMKSLRTPTGSLKIGLPSNAVRLIGPTIQQAIASALPNVRLHIVQMSSAFLYESLIEKRIDLAVLVNVAPLEGLEITPLFSEAFCFVTREQSIDATIPFAELSNHKLILSSQSTSWRRILDMVANERGVTFDILLETDSVFVMEAMLGSAGTGAIAPASAFLNVEKALQLVTRRIVEPEISSELSLVHDQSHKLSRIEAAAVPIVIEASRLAHRQWSDLAGLGDLLYPPPQTVRPVTPDYPSPGQKPARR